MEKELYLLGPRHFDPPLTFTGQWEVALMEISFILMNSSEPASFSYQRLYGTTWVTKAECVIPHGYYTAEQIVEKCNSAMPWKGAFNFRLNQGNLDILLSGNDKFIINKSMGEVLGVSLLEFSINQQHCQLQLERLEPCHLHFVTCDFIREHWVCAKHVPALDALAFQTIQRCQHVYHRPLQLDFYPLNGEFFNMLNIWVVDERGNEMPVRDLLCKLKFKQV